MMEVIISILLISLLVETLTELLIKSSIFRPVREKIFSIGSDFLTELFSCGYCFSVWTAFAVNICLFLLNFSLYNDSYLNLIICWLITHRISNILHGSIDRYFDTRKDIRYNRD